MSASHNASRSSISQSSTSPSQNNSSQSSHTASSQSQSSSSSSSGKSDGSITTVSSISQSSTNPSQNNSSSHTASSQSQSSSNSSSSKSDGSITTVFSISQSSTNPSRNNSQSSHTASSQSQLSSSSSSGKSGGSITTVPVEENSDYQEGVDDETEINNYTWGILTPIDTRYFRTFTFNNCGNKFKFGRNEKKAHYIFDEDDFGEDKRGKQLFTNISNIHFTIYKEKDKVSECGFTVYIHDKSTNGTYLDGELIGKGVSRPLKSCSKIAIADKKHEAFIFTNTKLEQLERRALPSEFRQKYILESVILGEGATGIVRRGEIKTEKGAGAKGKESRTDKKVAVKIIKKSNALTIVNDVIYEGHLMRQINHKNIVAVKDLYETDKSVYIVLEYIEGGELFDYVKTCGRIPEEKCKIWFLQLLEAVDYLHSKGIIHRDLKPENVLLSSRDGIDCVLKITDFGLSRIVAEQSLLKTLVGTSIYVAPEILIGLGYTRTADLWSLGCILFIMLSGTPPFYRTKDEQQLTKSICSGNYVLNEELWKNISIPAKDFIQKLLCVNPDNRISLFQALQHEWFSSYNPPKKQKLGE